MQKIIDVITYNGEVDLLEIRLNILNDYVDQFIICESLRTFSGKEKPFLSFENDRDWKGKFKNFLPKIKYFWLEKSGDYTKKEIDLAKNSPNTKGAEHWKTEFMIKERIKDSLTHLKDDDIVFIGDCDEIWNPQSAIGNYKGGTIVKLKLLVYTYWLNNRSNEQFWGTIVGKYGLIKNEILNHLRSNTKGTEAIYGWHFTSMGGPEAVRKKLTDSYTKETYANDWVMSALDRNIAENKDFLGRDFTFRIDENEWPQYLKDNRQKYKHLMGCQFPYGLIETGENNTVKSMIEKPMLPESD